MTLSSAFTQVLDQAADVVGVRMGVEEGVDEQPALFVPIQLLPELFGNIGRVIVLIVGRFADVNVDEDPTTGFGLEQHHVPVVDFEKRCFNYHSHPPDSSIEGSATTPGPIAGRMGAPKRYDGNLATQDVLPNYFCHAIYMKLLKF